LLRPDPSDEDLRQMFTYNHRLDCSHSILLYPDVHGIDGRDGAFVTRPPERVHGCSVHFARVWGERGGRICLNLGVGGEVMNLVRTLSVILVCLNAIVGV
jgi:hypothetical protein